MKKTNKKITWKKIKAQFTIYTLIMAFIMLLIFSKLYPTIQSSIDELIASGTDELTSVVVSLYPFLLAVAIIMSVWFYVIPRRET
jgi:uncharacterized membrane-anchored protein YitT (DUF2179 family)